MSWQSHIDTLASSGKIVRSAIIGLQGGVWASTPGYTISTAEQHALIAGFKTPHTIQESGFRLAEQKFFTLRVDDRSIYGKKVADGAVVVKTNQAIIIGEYVGPIQAPEATPVVEGLADYLIKLGY